MTARDDRGPEASPREPGPPDRATGQEAENRWLEVRQRIDDLEARLRRGRRTVPTYLVATVFFIATGSWTGNWPPAIILAGLCLGAAWINHRLRTKRAGQLRALEELEWSLPRPGAEASEADRAGAE